MPLTDCLKILVTLVSIHFLDRGHIRHRHYSPMTLCLRMRWLLPTSTSVLRTNSQCHRTILQECSKVLSEEERTAAFTTSVNIRNPFRQNRPATNGLAQFHDYSVVRGSIQGSYGARVHRGRIVRESTGPSPCLAWLLWLLLVDASKRVDMRATNRDAFPSLFVSYTGQISMPFFTTTASTTAIVSRYSPKEIYGLFLS